MKLSDIAEEIGGLLHGEGSLEITGVASIDDGSPGTISFLAEPKNKEKILQSKASAFVLPKGVVSESTPYISCDNPLLAFTDLLRLFHPFPSPQGVDPRAVIEDDAKLGEDVTCYANAYVGNGAIVGDRVTLYPGAYVGSGVTLGDDSIIYPNVVIGDGCEVGKRAIIHGGTVIGSDGYGFVWDGEKHVKIPQVGKVVIGDDVEIGGNTVIDRATLGQTEIKSGTKIDNLVHIAHNCSIGENSLIAGQVGISGSVNVGKRATFAGQVGVVPHVNIGDGVIAAGKSGITKNIEDGAVVSGFPARPHMEWMRLQKTIDKLPEIKKTVNDLSKKIETIELEEKK